MNPVDYSVIIPAYNEEKFIADTLRRLSEAMASSDMRGEVIVVDNNSTDRTAEIAAAAELNGSGRVQVVFEPVNQIARARNAGAREAAGRFLIFLDADTKVTPALLSRALDILSDGKHCIGGVLLSFGERSKTRGGRIALSFNWLAKKWQLIPGCFVFCLREAFDGVGGFCQKVYFSEEIKFAKAVKKWGKKRDLSMHLITDMKIETSSRKLDYPGHVILTALIGIFLLPLATRIKPLAWIWYKRMPRRTGHY